MISYKKIVSLVLLLFISVAAFSSSQIKPDFKDEIEVVQNTHRSLQEIIKFIKKNPEVFPAEHLSHKRQTNREQREIIWKTWQSFLDRMLVLDDIGRYFDSTYRKQKNREVKRQAFRIGYAAFLIQYRYAIDFIDLMENDHGMRTILNESVPEFGLEEDLYKKIKFRYLNVLRGAEFIRLNAIYDFYGEEKELLLTPVIDEQRTALWSHGKGKGSRQTARNALKIVQDAGFTAWYPIQKTVSELMGDIKVNRVNRSLINSDQIREMLSLLQPGDILLERREWYLSNVGLPGYWPHAALYIGTENERQEFFDQIKIINSTGGNLDNFQGNFDQYLKKTYPKAYQEFQKKKENGELVRVIEAISEGVSFTSLEHSADADSVAILRPRLDKNEIAIAIERAFNFSGRPYDFNFDFLTDSELVCTELVAKSYEKARNYQGLSFPTQKIIGREVTTANDIARMFDEEFGSSNQQLDLIAFYDGREWKRKAIRSDVSSFRESWKRPKWYIWVPDPKMTKTEQLGYWAVK